VLLEIAIVCKENTKQLSNSLTELYNLMKISPTRLLYVLTNLWQMKTLNKLKGTITKLYKLMKTITTPGGVLATSR
jgi:hypothetical protein